MLGDASINTLDANLKVVTENDQNHHQILHQPLSQCRLLLDSYNGLKSDYEEQRKLIDRRKQSKETQDQNPFVLVLVDGDHYLFADYLVQAGKTGGKQAAQLLRASIADLTRELLGNEGPQCRIMVRIYSNMLKLSKSMARTGLVRNEARSFSKFAASFSGAEYLFDYVDTGESTGGANCKINETFNLFVDSSQCRHIIFAACHNTKHLPLLLPYRGRTDHITLLKTDSFCAEFASFDLAVRELPTVFMSMSMTQAPIPSPTIPRHPKICHYYPKGNCSYGRECKNIHITPRQAVASFSDDNGSVWTSAHTGVTANTAPENTVRESADYATWLPSSDYRLLDSVPVNKDGERIDPYSVNSPTAPLGFNPVNVIKSLLRPQKCKNGPGCRVLNCHLGHHCQKGGCKGGDLCRFDQHAHKLDLTVARWEPPEGHEEFAKYSVHEAPTVAGWGSRSGHNTSDNSSVYKEPTSKKSLFDEAPASWTSANQENESENSSVHEASIVARWGSPSGHNMPEKYSVNEAPTTVHFTGSPEWSAHDAFLDLNF
ncbi:hypothetical protein BJX76DRAFT_352533 [Aspergillus varians]